MNQYVLILSLGPVQGFIAAARRSRDLWSGSWLLSEISKASARCLQQAGAELIFPAPQDPALLEPGSDFSVGNKIQAVVRADADSTVRNLARQAAQAAAARFRELAGQAREALGNGAGLRDEIWQQQIDDIVESQAAWARIVDGGYRQASETASRLLAARKATRDFAPAALAADDPIRQIPKSSLDGARETVLQEGKLALGLRRKLGLSESEQLDCAGITKRLAGKPEQFTPLTRLAAHPWLQKLDAAQLETLITAYEPLVRLDLATRVRGNAGRYAAFPFDAQYCYRFRLEAEINAQRGDAEAHDALLELQQCLRPIWRSVGEPCPYGAILLADGDKMGALLDEAGTQDAHVAITRALSAFAGSVPARVREFDGHAIYAGGDDVLAFLPLDQAHACARALSIDFADSLQTVARQLQARNRPTLSAGIAIGHILEPLGNLRALASRAEKAAKGDQCGALKRNALGISLGVRSGATVDLRLRWDDQTGHQTFARWIDAYRDKTIPSRIAYDTRAVHLRTAFALQGQSPQPGIPRAEFARMLDRARTAGGERLDAAHSTALQERAAQLPNLGQLADELIVARWLAARTQRDLGDEQ